MTDQQLPGNANAERSVLGCILFDDKMINTVIEQVKTEDFYFPKHQILYEAMLALNRAHEPIDLQTLVAELEREKKAQEIGGMDFIAQITSEPFYSANLQSYIDLVKNHALQRALIHFGNDVAAHAGDGADPSKVVLEAAEEQLLQLSQDRTRIGLTPVAVTMEETLARISELSMNQGAITGIPTGFRWLDHQLTGLHPSDLVLLAARPSMGKTALGLNIAYNVARTEDKQGGHPFKVAVFSLEMSKMQLTQRLFAMASGLDLKKIITGDLQNDSDWGLLFKGTDVLKDLPLYIDDTSSISVQELRAKCRRLKMEQGLDLIMVDYLQLMNADNSRRNENRQQEITQISRGLKALAKEMDCPVLALSQLSRKAESREGGRPLMSDLRESGAIEQDADVVMLLHREDYYDKDTEHPNITKVIIAKHRNGPTGEVELFFEDYLTRFKDVNREEDPTA